MKTAYSQLSVGLQRLVRAIDNRNAAVQRKNEILEREGEDAAWRSAYDAAWEVVQQAQIEEDNALKALAERELAEVRRFRRGVSEWRQFGVEINS